MQGRLTISVVVCLSLLRGLKPQPLDRHFTERYTNFKVIGNPGQEILHNDETATPKLKRDLVMHIPINNSDAFSEVTIEVPPHTGSPDNGTSMMILCEVQIYSVNHTYSCAVNNMSTGLTRSLRNETGYMDDFNGLVSSGTVLDFDCNRNYKLVGETSTTCTPDGSFSSPPPKCQAYTTVFTINGKSDKIFIIINETATITLRCEVNSGRNEYEIALAKDGELLTAIARNTMAATYSITSVSFFDAGTYGCFARNEDDGRIIPGQGIHQVLVRCPPRPLGSISNLTYSCALGDNLTLPIAFTAYPAPNAYNWYKQETDGNWTQVTEGTSSADQFASLTIASIQDRDYGQYKVEIVNDVGSLDHLFFVAGDGEPEPQLNSLLFVVAVAAGGIAGVETIVLIIVVIACVRRRNHATQDNAENSLQHRVHETDQVELEERRTNNTCQNDQEYEEPTPVDGDDDQHVYDDLGAALVEEEVYEVV